MTHFEIEHVKNVYDQISPHFDITRKSVWPDVEEFVKTFSSNSYVLDAGCGNGKNMCRDDCSFIGGDFCQNFLEMVQKKKNEAIQINVKTLPFRNNTFDHVICVAVIHHIKDKSDQIKAIKELIRVTKRKGTILITVWEAHGEYKKGDNYVDWNLQKKYNKEVSKDVVYKRYYYMYDDNELYKDIFRSISNIMIESFKSSHNNRFVIITKL